MNNRKRGPPGGRNKRCLVPSCLGAKKQRDRFFVLEGEIKLGVKVTEIKLLLIVIIKGFSWEGRL